MVQHKASNKLGITGQPMDHMHDLNHMKIDRLIFNFNNFNSLDDNIDELVCQIGVQFCAEGGPCDAC